MKMPIGMYPYPTDPNGGYTGKDGKFVSQTGKPLPAYLDSAVAHAKTLSADDGVAFISRRPWTQGAFMKDWPSNVPAWGSNEFEASLYAHYTGGGAGIANDSKWTVENPVFGKD